LLTKSPIVKVPFQSYGNSTKQKSHLQHCKPKQ
jgi:hypothetical protein